MRKISYWTEEFTAAESTDMLRDIALYHVERAKKLLGGAVENGFADAAQCMRHTLTIEAAIRSCDFGKLVVYDLGLNDLIWWNHAVVLKDLRQALAFFSKLEPLECGFDKMKEAQKSFEAAEALCAETNRLLKMRRRGEFQFSSRVEQVLLLAQRKIRRVIGSDPPGWGDLGYRFGNGATTLTKKRLASVTRKFADGVSCSDELLGAARAVLGELPMLCSAWASAQMHDDSESYWSVPVVLHDGVLEFVPKNAKTYRAIVKEPVLNGLAQLAVGDWMSDILRRRAGVDTTDQGRNQAAARVGSSTGSSATVDLQSASDCVATELVAELLPLNWFSFLARLRTGHLRIKREGRIKLEKFSSMGNGFTFPLESLIFWALAASCVPKEQQRDVVVYGDDIVIPVGGYALFLETLRAVGFIPNPKKSFATGPFRESCGCDYYFGTDVRPYFQDRWVSGETLFTLHNHYVRHGDEKMAQVVRRFIHPTNFLLGPDGYGDGHLLPLVGEEVPFKRKARHSRAGWGGYVFDTYRLGTRRETIQRPTDFVLPSYSVYRRSVSAVFDPKSLRAEIPKIQALPGDELEVRLVSADAEGRALEAKPCAKPIVEVLPIPEGETEEGEAVKSLALPGTEDDRPYKRLSIYVFVTP